MGLCPGPHQEALPLGSPPRGEAPWDLLIWWVGGEGASVYVRGPRRAPSLNPPMDRYCKGPRPRLEVQEATPPGGVRGGGSPLALPPPHGHRALRIVVAMSGGVDSSVAAGLLHEQGHEVIGVTLQLYDQGAASGRKGACCAGQDIHDARRVADQLGIAHYVIDAEERFARAVIADFADSYAAGETPVPCIRCNQTVKFADLTALASDLGAERLATGHYVRRVDGPEGAELHRAADADRDQSWFLFATTQTQLDRCLFPLGEMQDKRVVRDQAARLGLGVAEKADSQDICFVPSGSYAEIVGRLRPDALVSGDINGTARWDRCWAARRRGSVHRRSEQAARCGGDARRRAANGDRDRAWLATGDHWAAHGQHAGRVVARG